MRCFQHTYWLKSTNLQVWEAIRLPIDWFIGEFFEYWHPCETCFIVNNSYANSDHLSCCSCCLTLKRWEITATIFTRSYITASVKNSDVVVSFRYNVQGIISEVLMLAQSVIRISSFWKRCLFITRAVNPQTLPHHFLKQKRFFYTKGSE